MASARGKNPGTPHPFWALRDGCHGHSNGGAPFFGRGFSGEAEFFGGDDRKSANLRVFLATSDFLCKLHRKLCTLTHGCAA